MMLCTWQVRETNLPVIGGRLGKDIRSTEVRDGRCGRGQSPPGEYRSAVAGSNGNTQFLQQLVLQQWGCSPFTQSCRAGNTTKKLGSDRLPSTCAFSNERLEADPLAGTSPCSVEVGGLEGGIRRSGRQRLLAGEGKGLGPRGASDGQVECSGRPVPSRQIDIGGPAGGQAHRIRTLGKQDVRLLNFWLQPRPVGPRGDNVAGSVVTSGAVATCRAHARMSRMGVKHTVATRAPDVRCCIRNAQAASQLHKENCRLHAAGTLGHRSEEGTCPELRLRVQLGAIGSRGRGKQPAPHTLVESLGEQYSKARGT